MIACTKRVIVVAILALSSIFLGEGFAQEPPSNPTVPNTVNTVDFTANGVNTLNGPVAPGTVFDVGSNTFNIVAYATTNQLGVEVADMTPVLRSQLSLEEAIGVFITSITPDSPAAKAGFQQNDIVMSIAEDAVSNPEKFNELIGNTQGKDVVVKIIRQSKPMTLNVTIPTFARYELALQPRPEFVYVSQRYRIGVSLAEADDTLRSQLKLATGEGLVVTEVIADSPATKAGILTHDVLIKLDGKRLSTVEAVTEQIQEIKERQVTLSAIRNGQEMTIQITPQASTEQHLSTVRSLLLSNGQSPVQIWYSPQQVLMGDAYLNTTHGLHVLFANAKADTQSDAQLQIAELRKQLDAMTQSLQKLEETLKSNPSETKEEKTEAAPPKP